jgi:thioredoxin 1
MSADLAITGSEFDAKVLQSELPVLVDFWASWCGPCRMIAPHVEALAEEMAGKVNIFKLDVDTDGEVAAKFGIMSIPALLIFKDGQIADRMVGAGSKEDIQAWIEKNL